MRKKIILLGIGILLVIMSGCSSKKANLPTPPPTGLQGQQATPGTTIANPATALPQQTATSQTTTNPVLVPQLTPAPEIERQFNKIADELYSKVQIPVMMPLYWPPIPANPYDQNNFYGIQYSAGQDSYSISITTVSKQLPVNSPELDMPTNDSEANQWGNFGGSMADTPAPSFVVEKPKDAEPSVIRGYQGWKDPVSFYWETGVWQCEVLGSSGSLMEDAQALTSSFNESGELKNLQARSGKILVSDASHRYTFISWQSADGQCEYNLQYDGEIADAIRIANSFDLVK